MNLANSFLIGLPTLTDYYFFKSLVYLAECDDDNGAIGWIVNKQIEEHLAQGIRSSMGLKRSLPIFLGGPVNTSSVVILHSPDVHLGSTVKLNSQLSATREKTLLNMMNDGKFPEHWRIIIGQCGWIPGQLDEEFNRSGYSSWSYTSYDNSLMWNTSPKDQWNTAIQYSVKEQTNALLAPTFAD
jgi:putative transcriptional regulator